MRLDNALEQESLFKFAKNTFVSHPWIKKSASDQPLNNDLILTKYFIDHFKA